MSQVLRALSSLGRSAIRYAQHGWHVFPLQPRGKLPLIKGGGGFLAATKSVDTVDAWWRGQIEANIGLWPGQSGLVVIDLDGPDGEATARELGLLSEPTLECVTGREDGGRHLYFKRPDFTVTNAAIGMKVDVRCDAGYVLLPPSIHPSGRTYKWVGKVEDIRELPPAVVDVLRRAQHSAGSCGAQHDGGRPARDIAFEEAIGEGERNKALTRYAGRLVAKGIPEDEALILVSAVNQTKCKPPLLQSEINVMVAGIALRDAKKRVTSSGTTICLVDEATAPETRSAAALASEQVADARAILGRDISRAPRWTCRDLDTLVGPMLPGNLILVGALTGNGKSALLLSQMDAFATEQKATLYVPLEVDPDVNRLRWAAWRLNLDPAHVVRSDWSKLPEGSQDAIQGILDEQTENPLVHFVPDKRVTVGGLRRWAEWGKEQGCGIIMLDHFHRMSFGSNVGSFRVDVTEAARALKDMARELDIVVIATAQLNRVASDAVDGYVPPGLGRLKESGGLAEEADVVLMLSRRLRRDLPPHWAQDLKIGRVNERDLAEIGTMTVTCRKHRIDGSALDQSVFLNVINGRVQNKARSWETGPDIEARRDGDAD